MGSHLLWTAPGGKCLGSKQSICGMGWQTPSPQGECGEQARGSLLSSGISGQKECRTQSRKDQGWLPDPAEAEAWGLCLRLCWMFFVPFSQRVRGHGSRPSSTGGGEKA